MLKRHIKADGTPIADTRVAGHANGETQARKR
jgi:hypothetical protein